MYISINNTGSILFLKIKNKLTILNYYYIILFYFVNIFKSIKTCAILKNAAMYL